MVPQVSAKIDRPKISLTAWGPVRDAVSCLSLANISFARAWHETLSFKQTDTYFMGQIPSRSDYLAVVIAVLLLAGLFYGLTSLVRRRPPDGVYRALRFASFSLAILPINGFRVVVGSANEAYLKAPVLQSLSGRTLAFLVLPLCAATIWFAWRFQHIVTKFAVALLVATCPFCLVTFGQAAVMLSHGPVSQPHDGPVAPRLAGARTSPRVLWIIFDEWDYRLTFVNRPAGLALPEVDRFRAESVSATRAHSPARDTATSLPTLLTGYNVRTSPRGDVHESFSAEEVTDLGRVPWRSLETVFSAARREGFNTGLVGWYLPYCRMLNNVLCNCAWWPMPMKANSTGDTLLQKIAGQTISILETDSISPFGQSETIRHKVRIYQEFLAEAKRQVSDTGLGLVFLHVPVPHAPHIYDRRTGRFDLKNKPMQGYIDSLALLDRMFGDLRREMQASGTWDRTTMLLSADHPFRAAQSIDGKASFRIPFLLHFPGQTEAVSFDAPFNSIVSANLVLSILNGKVSNPAQAVAWLSEHRNDREAPVAVQ